MAAKRIPALYAPYEWIESPAWIRTTVRRRFTRPNWRAARLLHSCHGLEG
jgi:hypothetical protein